MDQEKRRGKDNFSKTFKLFNIAAEHERIQMKTTETEIMQSTGNKEKQWGNRRSTTYIQRHCISVPIATASEERNASLLCCDRESRAACAQSFAPWQQATIEIMLAISRTVACSHYTYNGVILHAHPVRGESHNQRNTTGEVATVA